ncbi:MAG: NAD(P)/FAD-dependent oxidoreductase [Chloroflexi bacterium]|nr:NAD(P)/FAD-dependent oxidoreductase [Chloroflexota bacterium]
MAGKTVAILGGGVGGVVVANRLRKLLNREHRVVLIDRNVWHSFAPSYTWVMLGWRRGNRISRDLRGLARKGIDFVAGEITAIDLANKRVEVGEQRIPYDYLVVSLGAQYGTGNINGLGQAWTFYSLEGAEGLHEELSRFQGGRVAVVISSAPYRCPAAPYEGALLLDYYFRNRRLREDVELRVFTPEPFPLPVAGKAVGEQVMELLAGREIWFSPEMQLRSVDNQKNRLVFADGTESPFDLLIATPVHSAPQVVRQSALLDKGQWVPVNRETLATEFENVFAIGDVTAIPLASGLMLPKAGVFAHAEAEVVARNIAGEIKGGKTEWVFGGQGACFLETGYHKAGYATGHFYAEPAPKVALRQPSFLWHWAKIGFEKLWLRRWF